MDRENTGRQESDSPSLVLHPMLAPGFICAGMIIVTLIAWRAVAMSQMASVIGQNAHAHPWLPWGILCFGVMISALIGVLINRYLKVYRQVAELRSVNHQMAAEIDTRKRAEELLQSSEDRLTRAAMGSQVGLWDWDIQSGELWYAPQCLRMLGYDEDDSGFKPHHEEFESRLHPNDRSSTLAAIKAHLEQSTTYDVRFRLRHKDGNYYWFRSRGVATRNTSGSPVHMAGAIQVITEQTTAEKQLRQANVFLDSLIEALPLMVFVKSAEDLRFVRFNRAGEELLGYPRENMIGKNDYDFFPEDEADAFTAKDRLVLTGGEAVEIPEESIQTKLKGERKLRTLKVPILDAEGFPRYLLGVSEDITEKRRTASTLLKVNNSLRERNRELQQFAYAASHDLQEPLRMVISYLQLIEQRYKEQLDEQADQFIYYAVDGAKRMQSLIEGLLQFSRLDTKTRPSAVVEVNPLLDEVMRDLSGCISESGAVITHDPLPNVLGVDIQIKQLLQNLISNALKYRGKDPPHIHIGVSQAGNIWCFKVSDNGIGIDPKYIEQVFQIFKRLHSHKEFPGTGIGLAICRRIVTHHCGRIWAESSGENGSTFFFTLHGPTQEVAA